MGWKYYLAVILGNITGILIHRSIRWYFENKRQRYGRIYKHKRTDY